MSENAAVSVILASAQSVAKLFVIQAVGYFSVLYPRKNPLLPASSVALVARFSFFVLLIPLIYGTTASSVTPASMGDYWFVIVGAFYVMGVSYLVPTLLNLILPIQNPRDFYALRIAATFPNIVAMSILIFPSLCEYPVVYQGYAASYSTTTTGLEESTLDDADDNDDNSSSELMSQCTTLSTTLIFCYFFSWSLAFWTLGCPQLMAAANMPTSYDNNNNKKNNDNDDGNVQASETAIEQVTADVASTVHICDFQNGNPESSQRDSVDEHTEQAAIHVNDRNRTSMMIGDDVDEEGETALQLTVISRLMEPDSSREGGTEQERSASSNTTSLHGAELGSATATIAPSCCSLDEDEAAAATTTTVHQSDEHKKSILVHVLHALRQTFTSAGFLALLFGFLTGCIPPLQTALFEAGGALRFIGSAIENLGLAASPVSTLVVAASLVPPAPESDDDEQDGEEEALPEESPLMSDPTYGPSSALPLATQQAGGVAYRRRSNFLRLGDSITKRSSKLFQKVPRSTPEMRRLLLWFVLSRQIISPAVVVATIAVLDCSGLLTNVPALAKLVLIVNSCVPGAQVVVVMLKVNNLNDTAAVVSKIYLPSYLMSIFTISAFTALGMWLTVPDEDGVSNVCQRSL